MSISLPLLLVQIFKLARKCNMLQDFSIYCILELNMHNFNMRYKTILTLADPAYLVITVS